MTSEPSSIHHDFGTIMNIDSLTALQKDYLRLRPVQILIRVERAKYLLLILLKSSFSYLFSLYITNSVRRDDNWTSRLPSS